MPCCTTPTTAPGSTARPRARDISSGPRTPTTSSSGRRKRPRPAPGAAAACGADARGRPIRAAGERGVPVPDDPLQRLAYLKAAEPRSAGRQVRAACRTPALRGRGTSRARRRSSSVDVPGGPRAPAGPDDRDESDGSRLTEPASGGRPNGVDEGRPRKLPQTRATWVPAELGEGPTELAGDLAGLLLGDDPLRLPRILGLVGADLRQRTDFAVDEPVLLGPTTRTVRRNAHAPCELRTVHRFAHVSAWSHKSSRRPRRTREGSTSPTRPVVSAAAVWAVVNRLVLGRVILIRKRDHDRRDGTEPDELT
jgi:hypothetical protein